ncbi:MAG: phosphoribosylanthranilate isomerase [Planctomycetaceae bacterium]|nr:phosphoribosylanthranilate isomerase [Planctomycetaceae bacterium]
MPPSFVTPGWIKVCGIRDAISAEAAANAGASAIGLNFFAKSPRSVTPDQAASIVAERLIQPIGLFVNHSPDEIDSIATQVGLTAVQLHGDETQHDLQTIHKRHPDWSILKAFRVADSLRPVEKFLAECRTLSVPLAGCLLDARVDGAFGGTGKVAPWELIANQYDRANWPPLILAGGLTCENVADAIRAVRPDGVDTASGVESSPGVKDTKLIARFVAEAKQAFAELNC